MSDVLDLLRQTGAIIADSHFVLTSGKHASTYINKDALYPHTAQTAEICRLFAEKLKELPVDAVIGPALGGIILSQWTAHHLSRLTGREVLSIYTEKAPDGAQLITRGYDQFVRGRRVVVVEDIITTGGSAKKAVETLQAAGAEVLAVAAMVNRNPREVTANYFGTRFFPLATLEIQAYEGSSCPLCKSGVPVNTDVGHGRKYLEKHLQK